jgi:hypothetical protein
MKTWGVAVFLACVIALPAIAQSPPGMAPENWETFDLSSPTLPPPAQDIFELQPNGLLHKKSGLRCPRTLETFSLTAAKIVPVSPARAERGDDVLCEYRLDPADRSMISLHFSRPFFPTAQVSLQATVESLPQISPDWRGWGVNVAPLALARGGVALSRGQILDSEAPGDPKVHAISDVWIGFATTNSSTWEVKLRPIGLITSRPSFDAAANAVYQPLIASGAMVIPDTIQIDAFNQWRWANPEAPETSALVHVASGLSCPAPPSGTAHYGLTYSDVGFRCRYGGGGVLWTLGVSRIDGEGVTPSVLLKSITRDRSMPTKWGKVIDTTVSGYPAATVSGSAKFDNADFRSVFLAVRANAYGLMLDVVSPDGGPDPKTLPAKEFMETALRRP